MSLQRSRRVWRRATALRAQFRSQKICKRALSVLHLYCNPLKSHKTAKGFFGKAWRKRAEIWKCLEKNLGGWQTRPGGARARGATRIGQAVSSAVVRTEP